MAQQETYVLKVGNEVFVNGNGTFYNERLSDIVTQIATVRREIGKKCILVSSGAIPLGRKILEKIRSDSESLGEKQLFSSVGQAQLMKLYGEALSSHGGIAAQMLVTRDGIKAPAHSDALKVVLKGALDNEKFILPIVNANDALDTDELKQNGGNNRLAVAVAQLIGASRLIIMTNVNGILRDKNSSESAIKTIGANDISWKPKAHELDQSNNGAGRLSQKCEIAQEAARTGLTTQIVSGLQGGVLQRILIAKRPTGTTFEAVEQNY